MSNGVPLFHTGGEPYRAPGGLLGRLEGALTSPMFLAGAGLLSGEGFSGALKGMQAGQRTRELPLNRMVKEAQINTALARAGYYQRGGAGGGMGLSATERMIQRLMKENPNLSYEDAIAQVRRAPRNDRISLERLAVQASRADPSKSLADWRRYYSLNGDGDDASGEDGGSVGDIGNAENVLQQARDAIAAGKSRDAVIQRLREMGIDPTGL